MTRKNILNNHQYYGNANQNHKDTNLCLLDGIIKMISIGHDVEKLELSTLKERM